MSVPPRWKSTSRTRCDLPNRYRSNSAPHAIGRNTHDREPEFSMTAATPINECIIGIGSNIDPECSIQAALMILQQETDVKGVSEWVKTTPIGIRNQNDFINGAIKIHTTLSQESFRRYLKNLEDKLGRDR